MSELTICIGHEDFTFRDDTAVVFFVLGFSQEGVYKRPE